MVAIVVAIQPKNDPKQINAESGSITAYYREYSHVAGGALNGLFLSQLVYWYQPSNTGTPKLKDKDKKGVYWIPKTVKKWAEELAMEPHQVRKAIETLTELGIVAVETRLHGRDNVTHIRLLCANGKSSIKGYPMFGKQTPSLPEQDPLSTTQTPLRISQTFKEINKENKEETKTESGQEQPEQEPTLTTSKPEQVVATAKEILEIKKPTISTTKVFGSDAAAILWKKLMGLRLDCFQTDLTKEKRMSFTTVLKKLRESKDAPSLREMIEFTFERWDDIRVAMKAAGALADSSDKFPDPDVGMFVKHHNLIIALMHSDKEEFVPKKPLVVVETPVQPVQSVAPKVPPAPSGLLAKHGITFKGE